MAVYRIGGPGRRSAKGNLILGDHAARRGSWGNARERRPGITNGETWSPWRRQGRRDALRGGAVGKRERKRERG